MNTKMQDKIQESMQCPFNVICKASYISIDSCYSMQGRDFECCPYFQLAVSNLKKQCKELFCARK